MRRGGVDSGHDAGAVPFDVRGDAGLAKAGVDCPVHVGQPHRGVRALFSGGFRSRRTRTNLTFLATTMAINVAFGSAAVGLFEWTAATEFGLLYWW